MNGCPGCVRRPRAARGTWRRSESPPHPAPDGLPTGSDTLPCPRGAVETDTMTSTTRGPRSRPCLIGRYSGVGVMAGDVRTFTIAPDPFPARALLVLPRSGLGYSKALTPLWGVIVVSPAPPGAGDVPACVGSRRMLCGAAGRYTSSTRFGPGGAVWFVKPAPRLPARSRAQRTLATDSGRRPARSAGPGGEARRQSPATRGRRFRGRRGSLTRRT